MSTSLDEPTIPPRLRRPLAAVWISLGLHAAVIALVQVVPPTEMGVGEPVIEVRLVSKHIAAPSVVEPLPTTPEIEMQDDIPEEVPMLAPSETPEVVPVAEPAPPVAASQPDVAPAEMPPASAPSSAPAPAAVIPSSVDLTYYSARDLDVQPRALSEIVPDYPADADRRQLSGKVRLQLKLEADGRVIDVEVVSANPPDVFDESAIKALRAARFFPAQKAGRPVRAQVQIEVIYDWEGNTLVQSRVKYEKEGKSH
ncbi:energy transducer TonB [Thiobacillus sp.]